MADLFFDDFPFKPKDILSSPDAATMSAAEFGVYCKLLFASWLERPQCYLRLDVAQLCKLCHLNAEEWETIYPRVILRKFELTYKGGDGSVPYIYNKKLLSIWNDKVKEQKTAKGKAKQLTQVAQLLNYTFEEFWNDYDKKVGHKPRLIPKWIKLTETEREQIRKDLPKRKEFQPDKKLRPNPETYLNGRRWEDEYIDCRKPTTKTALTTANYNEQKHNPV